MDIDLRLLKQVEIDRDISFKELVEIIEAAVVAAFHRHIGNHDPAPLRTLVALRPTRPSR
jgi:N utilization substance protein A